jgi:hypothetical protein
MRRKKVMAAVIPLPEGLADLLVAQILTKPADLASIS